VHSEHLPILSRCHTGQPGCHTVNVNHWSRLSKCHTGQPHCHAQTCLRPIQYMWNIGPHSPNVTPASLRPIQYMWNIGPHSLNVTPASPTVMHKHAFGPFSTCGTSAHPTYSQHYSPRTPTVASADPTTSYRPTRCNFHRPTSAGTLETGKCKIGCYALYGTR
jgi:hypothetical protein